MPATSAARAKVHSAARSRSRSHSRRVRRQECLVGQSAREQVTVKRQRDGDVGAGPHGEMNVGRAGERGRPRVDHDQLGAALLRLAHVRDEMNARRRWIDAPEHDQRGVDVVLVGHRRHLAVERHVGRAGRRRAHRPRQSRRPEPPPQRRVEVVVGEQAIRSAVGERQNRLGTRPCDRARASDRRSGRAPRPTTRGKTCRRLCGPFGPPGRAAGPDRRRAHRTDAPSRRCSRR